MFPRSSRGQEDLSLETISKIEACLGIQILPTSVMKSIIPINRNFADSAMTKFILNRPDDYLSLSKKRIIGTTLKWFVILMVGAIMLRIACVAIYMSMGVNPMDLTKFGGDPTNYVGHATWKALLKLMVIAPLAEEIMFRLGLSFKRRTVALCPCYHNGPYGRRLRHHICQSQSWILVGRSTALHHQYSWCFDDCLVYNITGD